MSILLYTGVCFVILLALDFTWIKFMMPMYNNTFLRVQGSALTVKLDGALVAYCFMFVSLLVLVLPMIRVDTTISNKFLLSLKHAGSLGLVIYGIYNATNYATLKGYAVKTALLDTLWGVTVYTLSVYCTLLLLGRP